MLSTLNLNDRLYNRIDIQNKKDCNCTNCLDTWQKL